MDGFRETVLSWISDSIEGYCRRIGLARIWGKPLVGLADAESPMFRELETTAHRGHRVPQDYLPGAVTVVSYFLPFVRYIAEDNEGGDSPSGAWVAAYRVTNDMGMLGSSWTARTASGPRGTWPASPAWGPSG